MAAPRLEVIALSGLPLVQAGDDIARMIGEAIATELGTLQPRDVIVVAQKIISKAEGRTIALSDVTPSDAACDWATKTDKDPRLVELILSESKEVVRHRPGVMIVEHKLGFVMANAGIDQSNAGPDGEKAILLPENPDASAATLRAALTDRFNADIGIVINDSFGRAWRAGTCGVAIGVAGLPAIRDLRGDPDLFGRELAVSITGFADEIAAAASLVMGQGDEGLPAAVVRGLSWPEPATTIRDIIRSRDEDLFR